MSWLERYVRPKIKALVGAKPEVPENLWHKCDNCGQMIFHRDLEANLRVCQHCNHHMRLPVLRRLETLFDDGVYERIELPKSPIDPLKFRDRRRYTDRLKESGSATGEKNTNRDAMVVAHGAIEGHRVVVGAFDFAFMGGSMGVAVGEAIVSAARLAVLQRAPLILIPATGGARMQEGILSLMQMPRTVIAVQEVKEAGLPYFVLLTNPTTGGVSASFAMLGDVHIAEPGALIGFAGRRVIEQTVKETLPERFQSAEYLLEHGMVDIVVSRGKLRATLARLIRLLVPDAAAMAGDETGKETKDGAAAAMGAAGSDGSTEAAALQGQGADQTRGAPSDAAQEDSAGQGSAAKDLAAPGLAAKADTPDGTGEMSADGMTVEAAADENTAAKMAGSETAGTETAGSETAGTETAGSKTAGTHNADAETMPPQSTPVEKT